MRARAAPAAAMLLLVLAPAECRAGGFKDRLAFTFGARLRGEWVDYFDPPGGEAASRYVFGGSQLRAGLRGTFPSFQFTVEAQDTRLLRLPTDASLPAPFGNLGPGAIYYAHHRERDQGETFLKQAHLTFRRSGISAQVGRFEYSDGLESIPGDASLAWLKRSRLAERLIGPFGYTHVSRSFDGLRLAYDRASWNATAFGFRPTRGGYDVRANPEIADLHLGGLALTLKPTLRRAPADFRAFYIYSGDDRLQSVRADNRPLAVRQADREPVRVHTLGAHAATVLPAGPGAVDLLLWSAGQRGDWGALDHEAWAMAAEAGYQLTGTAWTPWIRLGYNRGSGDADAADGRHATFFQVIPTPRIYAQFPFYNTMNGEDAFAQLMLRPHDRISLRSDVHWLRLTERADLWYSGGGATNDQMFGFSGLASAGRRSLARLVEVSVAVRIHPRLGAYAYYSHAFGGDVVTSRFPGSGANYGYLELTFRY